MLKALSRMAGLRDTHLFLSRSSCVCVNFSKPDHCWVPEAVVSCPMSSGPRVFQRQIVESSLDCLSCLLPSNSWSSLMGAATW